VAALATQLRAASACCQYRSFVSLIMFHRSNVPLLTDNHPMPVQFFKIARGINECNIESHVTGGMPVA
jgi:hypothetical protein